MGVPIGAIVGKALESAEVVETTEVLHRIISEAETIADKIWPEIEDTKATSQLSPEEIGKEAWNSIDVSDNPEKSIAELASDYIEDLKKYSECPDTIPKPPFDIDDLKKRPAEENKELRSEFTADKNRLIEEWEKANGMKWPVYEKDIYNEYGDIVKKQGWKYDAHHIHPLSLGGKNEAANITPLRYDIHTDHKGVHAIDSPYDILDKRMIKEGI